MYKQLFKHIKKVSPNYSEVDLNNLIGYFEFKTIPKGKLLLQEGTVCHYAYYVIKGCFRYYTTNSEGNQFNTQFAFEDWWLGDMQSLIHRSVAKINIESLEDCSVLVISARDYNYLLQNSRPFAIFKQRLRAKAYQSRIDHSNELHESAEHRYMNLLSKHPSISQRIPQYHIASYLSITPESLSRIRKKITL